MLVKPKTITKPILISLILIFMLAAYLRIDFLHSVDHHMSHDSIHYDAMVRQLLEDGIYAYKDTEPNAQVSPGYPLFLVAIYSLVDYEQHDPLPWVRFMQLLLSLATLLLIFHITTMLSNAKAGVLAVFIAAIYPSFVWSNGAILTEVLAAFLLMSYLWMQIKTLREHSSLWALFAGIALGLTVLTRPEFLPLVFAVYGFYGIWKKDLKNTLKLGFISLLGVMILLSPWVIRNVITLDDVVITASQVNPFAAGTYPDKNYDDGLVDHHGKTQMQVALERLKVGFTEYPLTFLKWYTFGKLQHIYGHMFLGSGHSPMYNVIPFVPPGATHLAIIGFGIYALVVLLRNWRQFTSVLIVTLITMSIIRLGFVPEYRYNFTVMPIIIILNSIVGVKVLQWLYSKVRRPLKS